MRLGKLKGRTPEETEQSFNDLQNLLDRRLTFSGNFESAEVEVTLNGTTEVAVRNPFRDGNLPTKYIVVRSDGNCVLQDGTTAWTTDFIYLQNAVAASPTITVLFFK